MKELWRRHHIHLGILLGLLFVGAVSGFIGWFHQPIEQLNNRTIPFSTQNDPQAKEVPNSTTNTRKNDLFVYNSVDKIENGELRMENKKIVDYRSILSTTSVQSAEPGPKIDKVIQTTLIVNNSLYKDDPLLATRYQQNVIQGSTVYDLMKELTRNSDFVFSGKEFSGGLGFFVEEINGIRNNREQKNHYWIYSINGQKAKVGVSTNVVQSNDIITWTYEKAE